MAKKRNRNTDTVTTTKAPVTNKRETTTVDTSGETKVFHRINYILMVVSMLLLILGYVLMIGGRQAPNEFNPEELFSFTRVTLSPIIIVAGFSLMIFAILWKPKPSKDNTVSNY